MSELFQLDREWFRIIHSMSGDRTLNAIWLGITQSGLAHIQAGALLTVWSTKSPKAWVQVLVPFLFVATAIAVGLEDGLALNHVLVFLIFTVACLKLPVEAIKAGLIGFAFGGVLHLILKQMLDRERPSNFTWAIPLENVYLSPSFPSGHTSSSAGMGFAIAMMMPWTKVAWSFAIWAILVGVSRIYVGVHFPSDVIAGFGCGLVGAGITKWLLERNQTPEPKKVVE